MWSIYLPNSFHSICIRVIVGIHSSFIIASHLNLDLGHASFLCESVEVTNLKAFMVAMEDAGELVSLLGSKKTDNDELQSVEKIVFIMDAMKSTAAKRRKITKASGFTFKLYQVMCPNCLSAVVPHALCGCCNIVT